MAGRLNQGGIATYWLPVSHLTAPEAKAIVRGFCNVFADASLWAASPVSWMLVGTKGLNRKASAGDFIRPWSDPVAGPKMRDLGFVSPGQMGSLFIADGERLRRWIADAPPLADNFPKRLSDNLPDTGALDPGF